MEGTFTRVQKVISRVTGKKSDEITLDTFIFKNLNIQSIDIVDLNFELEKDLAINSSNSISRIATTLTKCSYNLT